MPTTYWIVTDDKRVLTGAYAGAIAAYEGVITGGNQVVQYGVDQEPQCLVLADALEAADTQLRADGHIAAADALWTLIP